MSRLQAGRRRPVVAPVGGHSRATGPLAAALSAVSRAVGRRQGGPTRQRAAEADACPSSESAPSAEFALAEATCRRCEQVAPFLLPQISESGHGIEIAITNDRLLRLMLESSDERLSRILFEASPECEPVLEMVRVERDEQLLVLVIEPLWSPSPSPDRRGSSRRRRPWSSEWRTEGAPCG